MPVPEFEVSCVRRSGGATHKHIVSVGGRAGGGWVRDVPWIIGQIEKAAEAFFTTDDRNRKIYIGVVKETDGSKYLRTHADGQWNDNLVALPECPSTYR